MITSLAAATALALSATSAAPTPVAVGDLPRITSQVDKAGGEATATLVAPPPREDEGIDSKLGLQILGGSTMAGGTGSPWVRPQPFEKQRDDREMNLLKAAEKKDRTIKKVLIGLGVFAAASAVGMIATGGAGGGGAGGVRSQAQALQEAGAGPRGGGAAFVWKVGFR